MPTISGNIHYVKFIRSSAAAWTNLLLTPAKIDDDTLYFIYEASDTTKGKLYLGQRLISGAGEKGSSSVNISDIGGIYIDDETLGNKQILVYNEANDQWENTPLSDIIGEAVSVMTGATAAADGIAGLVPQPKVNQQVNFLRGDGTWAPINIPSFDSSVLIPNSQNQITLTGIEQAAIGTIPVKTASGIEWRQQSSEQLNHTIVTMEQLNDLIANEEYNTNTIYMVSKNDVEDGSDYYDEYLVINNQAERLGTFGTVNLSDYVTNTVFESHVGNLENILNDKTDSETGNLIPGLVTRFETFENSNLRDPGYGKITPGTASTATEAIIANTTQIAAGTYNENLNINPGNKWVQVSATSGASNGGDTLTLGHALSDVTAGISSPNAAQIPGFNSTFNIPTVTVDEAGHVTAMGTTTVKIPANPNTDITVKQTAKTDNVDYKILTTTSASPISGSAAEAGYGVNLVYNPSTNTLKTGNASLTGALNVTGQATFNQIPVSITPEANSSDTSIATTAFVKNAIGGLSGSMHFRGTTTTTITDGSITNPITISGNSYTAAAGDVVLREVTTGNIFEYVWTGSAWEMLGRDTSFKVTQAAVPSPTANGNTTAFIDTISQDTNGNITVTKKNLDTSGTWSGTATKATADGSGNNIIDTYATKQYVDNAEVSSAATLITPRTIQTDLTSNTAVFFDGSSNITLGVTGILGITNGGTGNADGYIRTGQHSGSTIGDNATVEGIDNIASGGASHAEGINVTASGEISHAEGLLTIASGGTTHAEGVETTASGDVSHSEGIGTVASGRVSHAEGVDTIAKGTASHVFGEYNEEDVNNITRHSEEGYGNYVEIVGNGNANNARSNARTLDWNGNEVLAGKLTVGANPTNDMDVVTKQYFDNRYKIGTLHEITNNRYEITDKDDNNIISLNSLKIGDKFITHSSALLDSGAVLEDTEGNTHYIGFSPVQSGYASYIHIFTYIELGIEMFVVDSYGLANASPTI